MSHELRIRLIAITYCLSSDRGVPTLSCHSFCLSSPGNLSCMYIFLKTPDFRRYRRPPPSPLSSSFTVLLLSILFRFCASRRMHRPSSCFYLESVRPSYTPSPLRPPHLDMHIPFSQIAPPIYLFTYIIKTLLVRASCSEWDISCGFFVE